jgi:hypothetical protein
LEKGGLGIYKNRKFCAAIVFKEYTFAKNSDFRFALTERGRFD